MLRFAAAALAVSLSMPAFAADLYSAATTRKYADVKIFLQQLVAAYPEKVRLFNLGVTDSKEELLGVKIGSGAIHNIVVGTHHGNEYGSAEMALAFAEDVAKQPIAGQTIYVIPVLNIGGYDARTRREIDSRGVSFDPNRNYPGPCGTQGPFTLKSTKAVADFIAQENIITSATLHTFFPAVVYPWGISTHDLDNAYPNEFKKLVDDATLESHYRVGNSTEVIYPADGAYEDYAYMKHGIWSILFELGTSHSPNENAIKDMVRVNLPGMRRMFANAPIALAANHEFKGRCDLSLRGLDRQDE